MVRPWRAGAPQSFDRPAIDYSRFDVTYWQKWERMLRFARDRDMVISVILDISTHKGQAAAGSQDERRYFRYAAARLGAFSNITWDLGDDLDSFRDEKWAHELGTFLQECWWKTDPHDELVSHGCYCLARPGELYAVYLPNEGTVTVHLEPGIYDADWFTAFTGERIPLPSAQGPEWTSPQTTGRLDWALLLKKKS